MHKLSTLIRIYKYTLNTEFQGTYKVVIWCIRVLTVYRVRLSILVFKMKIYKFRFIMSSYEKSMY